MYPLRQSRARLQRGPTLIAAILFCSLASAAIADEFPSREPALLTAEQRQAHAAPIQPKASQDSTNFDPAFTPAAFQAPARQLPATHEKESKTIDPSTAANPPTSAANGVAEKPAATIGQSGQYTPALSRTGTGSSASGAPLPLSPGQSPKPLANPAANTVVNSTATPRSFDSLVTVAASLGIVLGLFFVIMWCLRRGMPKAIRPLPAEVVEILGRTPLAGRQQMHLIRLGSKLVLVAVSPQGVDTISEITNPAEADRLAGYCETTRSASATASFRGLLDRLAEREPLDHEELSAPRGRRLGSGRARVDAEDTYV
jgi:flagellar protein FliO/FliZ